MTAPEVRPGQIWADNDPRSAGRTLRVLSVGERYAHLQVLTVARNVSTKTIGTQTRIQLNRMRPTATGYRLINQPKADQ